MNRSKALIATVAILGLSAPGNAMIDPAFTRSEAVRWADEAYRIAGSDMRILADQLCVVPPTGAKGPPAEPVFEPFRMFDNLYFFGSPKVGATVIQTSEGLILIDALTTVPEVESQLLAGMRAKGLDPADIKYLIITHAHGDHFNGASHLRSLVPGMRIIAEEADWPTMERPGQYALPRGNRDIAYDGSYRLELGDQVVDLYHTPGHTPGTTSLIYRARNYGRPVTVMQWGGGYPTHEGYALDTVERFAAISKREGASVRWGSHMWLHAETPARTPNHTIVGREWIDRFVGQDYASRYWDIAIACKKAIIAQTS